MKQDCRLGLWMYHSGMTKVFPLYLVEVKEMHMLHWYRIMFCWYHIIFIFVLQWNRHILKVSEDWNTSGCCVYRKVRLFFLRDCFLFSASTCRQTVATLGWMCSIIWRTFSLSSCLFYPFWGQGEGARANPSCSQQPWMSPQLFAGPYVSIWGFITLFKGTRVVFWSLPQSTFPVWSTQGLEPRAPVPGPLQTELPPPVIK